MLMMRVMTTGTPSRIDVYESEFKIGWHNELEVNTSYDRCPA